jgi:SAM-dependent methyltransferase
VDLRSYDVPAGIADILEAQIAAGVSWYQPFVFTDDVIAGTAAVWNAGEDRFLCTARDSAQTRANFLRETLVLSAWYHWLTDIITTSFPDADSYLDFGCNMGHFGIDLAARGRTYTGIDVARNQPGVELLQRITGSHFEFTAGRYDEDVHRLDRFDEARQFDVGILSVVIMHLTDPHYALPYFAAKIRHGIFFSSNLTGGGGHLFRARIRLGDRNRPLPHTFELVPTEALCETMLRHSGFPHLYKIPYRDGIDPRHSRLWGCWIAAREPIPDDAVRRFDLRYVPDRVDDFADAIPAGAPADSLRMVVGRPKPPDPKPPDQKPSDHW